MRKVLSERDLMSWPPGGQGPPPVIVKIAPDLTPHDMDDIAAVVLATAVDGLVISNTTIARPDCLRDHPHAHETGGLSGRPLMELSTHVVGEMYRRTRGAVPIIGVGGVANGEDAYRKVRAGASLVEVYSMFAYEGPALVRRIKRELAACLRRDGFQNVGEAVGADHRRKPEAT